MSLAPPAEVTVSQDLDTLRITFPARTEKTQVPGSPPEPTAANTPLKILSILLIYPALLGTFAIMLSWSSTMEIFAQLPLWVHLMHVAIIGSIIAMAIHAMTIHESGSPQEDEEPLRTVRRSLRAATVELRPHHLVIRSRASTQTIPLADIDTVTVDKAGARIRVQGRMHYLLSERTDTERAWLAELLRAAVQTRQAGTVNSDAERARLETLLQRT